MELIDVLEKDGWQKNKSKSNDKEWHGECPVCGTNTPNEPDRFIYTVANDKAWCRQCGFGANHPVGYLQARYKNAWKQHAERLGVEISSNGNGASSGVSKADLSRVPDTPKSVTIVTPPDLPDTPTPKKAQWDDLNDFCENKVGIPLWFATDKLRWSQGTGKDGKPIVKMKMDDGSFRCRPLHIKTFWSIASPDHKNGKIPPSWYMMPDDNHNLIVLCNGQTSTAAARFHGIQAFCFTDGEKAVPQSLLGSLKRRLTANTETVCIIALDGDNAGRKATKAIVEQLAGLPIRVVDFGGQGGYDLGDFCKRYKGESLEKLKRLSYLPDNAQIQSSSQTSAALATNLTMTERFPNAGEYLPMPFKSFHRFGGMMKALHPGLVTIIGAPSGHGKTSFAETLCDKWMRLGFDILWWGSEWSPEQYAVRRVQRYGGMTIDQFSDYQIWKRENDLNVPEAQRFGVKLLPDVIAKSLQVNRMVKSWPGKIWYFPKRRYVEETQDEMRSILHQLRREGRRIGAIVWDYVSLLRSQDGDANNQPQSVLGAIKDFSIETNIATIALSQVNKTTTARIKSGENTRLTTSDLYYIREDDGNLVIGLNPIYEKMNDGSGIDDYVFTNRVRAEILKNSLGVPYGNVMIKANLKHLSFEEYKAQ
jgi:hypothetical protein